MQKADKYAFLFSLENGYGTSNKLVITTPEAAIRADRSLGPTFGFLPDLSVDNLSNTYNSSNRIFVGGSYELPLNEKSSSYNLPNFFFTGSPNFQASEIEVFSVPCKFRLKKL